MNISSDKENKPILPGNIQRANQSSTNKGHQYQITPGIFQPKLSIQIFQKIESALSSAEKSLKGAISKVGSETEITKMQFDSEVANSYISSLNLDRTNLSDIKEDQLNTTIEKLRDIKDRIINLQSNSGLPLMNLDDRSTNYEKITERHKKLNAENTNSLAQVEETLLFCKQEISFRKIDEFTNKLNNSKGVIELSNLLKGTEELLEQFEKVLIPSPILEVKVPQKPEEKEKILIGNKVKEAQEHGKKVESNLLRLQAVLGKLMLNINDKTTGYKQLEKDYEKSQQFLKTITSKLNNLDQMSIKLIGEIKKHD